MVLLSPSAAATLTVRSSSVRRSGGVTIPPEITIFMPSSTVIDRMTSSRRGKNRRYPDVGFGVVGRKTLTTSSSVELENLLEGAVNAADNGHSRKHPFADP
jgi:hypothetical protein